MNAFGRRSWRATAFAYIGKPLEALIGEFSADLIHRHPLIEPGEDFPSLFLLFGYVPDFAVACASEA
jgi:hypothetical protein